MKPPIALRFSVRQLWRHCERSVFAIPEIQREFVWDARRAASLLDSMYKGLPIGTLVLWETHKDHRLLLRHAQHALPPYNPVNKDIWFLLDGQQRLSVLHRVKVGGEVHSSHGRTLDFSKLCFLFGDRSKSKFRLMKRPVPKMHIPIVEIINPGWRRRLRYLSEAKLREIGRMRDQIAYYRSRVTSKQAAKCLLIELLLPRTERINTTSSRSPFFGG